MDGVTVDVVTQAGRVLVREFYRDWTIALKEGTVVLRFSAGAAPDSPRLRSSDRRQMSPLERPREPKLGPRIALRF